MGGAGLATSENRHHRLSGNDGELHELSEAALVIRVRAILVSLRSSIRVESSDARICDVSALSHLPIGRPSSSFAREVGGSAASIAAKKVSLLVERHVPVTALHWIEMFLRFLRPPAIAHSRLALAKARAILSLSLQ